MSTPVLSIVGRSGSGKTTLMEKLIAALTDQGLTIGTIKHSHHQPDMDTPGKDSWRHKKAGAAAALLLGSECLMMVADVNEAWTPRLLATRYFPNFDLVLVEGCASMEGSKIEVIRSACSVEMRHSSDQGVIAIVSDVSNLNSTLPQFDLDDVYPLTAFIHQWMKR